MDRRKFLYGFAGLVVAPCAAQTGARIPRVGFLTGEPAQLGLEPFKEGLRARGYEEGRNVVLEVRLATAGPAQLPKLAEELVRSKVDVIVVGGSDSIRAAQRATTTIPIVMAQTSDAVGSGFVSSLARPGGNITGISGLSAELAAKRLQLVKQVVPGARRVALLSNPGNPSHTPQVRLLEQAAPSLGLEVRVFQARKAEDFRSAFAAMAKASADALLVLPDTLVNPQTEVLALATAAKLPVIWWRREFVEAGGLLSYGQDNPAMYRQAADYVDRILKGARPADLAVEQPSKVEVFVNLRSARALGLQIPQSILLLADKVIQ